MSLPAQHLPDHPTISNQALIPHIIPALAALFIIVTAVICFNRYASRLEDRYVHALAPLQLPQAMNGSVLQQAALRQPDLLAVYGSSEMLSEPSPYQAPQLFASYPNGFAVFNISAAGENPLDIAQELAALGPVLKNKKVVISFTPSMFDRTAVEIDQYAGNFSRMHAYALAFSPYLSMSLKQRVAKRMVDYPETLRHDMVLALAVRNLARGGLASRLKYALIYPLGQLEALIIRMQDHYAVWYFIQTHPEINPFPTRAAQPIDWTAKLTEAETEQQAATCNNSYGFENNAWIETYHQHVETHPAGSADQQYRARMENSKEWGDLELVLDIFREVGAKPMILSRPIQGRLYAAAGVSPQAQQGYYAKLGQLVGNRRFPLADFKEYTADTLFSIDGSSHTSRKGWVIVDRTLDAFYHDTYR